MELNCIFCFSFWLCFGVENPVGCRNEGRAGRKGKRKEGWKKGSTTKSAECRSGERRDVENSKEVGGCGEASC